MSRELLKKAYIGLTEHSYTSNIKLIKEIESYLRELDKSPLTDSMSIRSELRERVDDDLCFRAYNLILVQDEVLFDFIVERQELRGMVERLKYQRNY